MDRIDKIIINIDYNDMNNNIKDNNIYIYIAILYITIIFFFFFCCLLYFYVLFDFPLCMLYFWYNTKFVKYVCTIKWLFFVLLL